MLSVDKIKNNPVNKILLPFANIASHYIPTVPVIGKSANNMFPHIGEGFFIYACVCVYVRICSFTTASCPRLEAAIKAVKP